MIDKVRRVYVEKKDGFNIEAQNLYKDLKNNLGIKHLKSIRIINRYDIEGISDDVYAKARDTIFSEPPVDNVYDEKITVESDKYIFGIEYLPGQYDQRADSASQAIQILTHGEKPKIKTAKLIVIKGDISDTEYKRIKDYCINPVESREASLYKPEALDENVEMPQDVKSVEGFIIMNDEELYGLINDMGLAMDMDDIKFCQLYFRDTEKRDPTITEIRIIDTYWSDHCRHTTFSTVIDNVDFGKGIYSKFINDIYGRYLYSRKFVYGNDKKDICFMDIATIAMKELKKRGKLEDLDESEEINACSIVVDIDIDGKNEKWLIMFKNETHNHPTEIEPFGGAATCLGGAIRDPLSGRSYVYQAMRVTGSGDPTVSVASTIPGKLPQRKITKTAAAGYSSYGNQIGLATGQVAEIYDEGYTAKRMEIGAVVGAVPKDYVVRKKPKSGDVVILLGGKTGRDGCGGATGSSKAHTEESLRTCGAEVQKGNPPEERKIQRLFRNKEVTRMIKRCNDFGAGGVSVAVGELADGLLINLEKVPKKYKGLDGTELAISESQERMAVVVSSKDADRFIDMAQKENLEATKIADVIEDKRVKMLWREKNIVNISRKFLNSNGAKKNTKIVVREPDDINIFSKLDREVKEKLSNIKEAWFTNLQRLNVCSQKGLVEMFDSTIGAGTVLMPFGGKYQLTPPESMVAKIPVLHGDTNKGTIMSYGYNPVIAKWSPFHGAVYAIVEAVSKVVVSGGDYRNIRLTLQEYFEKPGQDPERWGKPFAALLGAYYAQMKLNIPAIGGKDSMSGTFNDLDVPPTLVAFAVDMVDTNKVISPEFKEPGNTVVYIPLRCEDNNLPDFEQLDDNYTKVHELIINEKVLAASTVRTGGLAETISKMSFGNKIGFTFQNSFEPQKLFCMDYGSIVLEISKSENIKELLDGIDYIVLGHTTNKNSIIINDSEINIDTAIEKWQQPLESVFPTKVENMEERLEEFRFEKGNFIKSSVNFAKPKVFIPVFPGTNCEYDSARAFEKAGGAADVFVFRNLSAQMIEDSIKEMVKKINDSQIIMIPGGFSAGDEPEGSGKFIATIFRNPRIKDAVMKFLNQRDGLILGICNGFQALIKLGLLPYGEIRNIDKDFPTLTFNTLGRHASCMVRTRIVSNLSPWFSNVKVGDVHTVAISHGEGRFVASDDQLKIMKENGQIATQYVNLNDKPTYDIRYNPNGSIYAIEGITSPDGRVLGKMGHSERIGMNISKNVPGIKNQRLFEAGVNYFK